MKLYIKNILNKTIFVALGAGVSAAVFLILFSGLWKYKALDNALKEAEKPTYDVTEYNCVNFSQDAVAKLQSKNINSNVVVVKQNPTDKRTHAVIGVWIDPQNGQFVSGAQYVGDYTELKNKFGWAK